MTDISISLVGPDQRLALGAANRATAAEQAVSALVDQANTTLGLVTAARDQVLAVRQRADLYVPLTQSLGIAHAPQVTAPGTVVPTLYTFNGGSEAPSVTSPVPINAANLPIEASNMASLVPYQPMAGVEGWGPGLGYQSAKAGVPASFVFMPGNGSMSIQLLHVAHITNLKHALYRAVKLLRAMGFEPTIHLIFNQGHADSDAVGDGNQTGVTPTSQSLYTLGMRKLFATMRVAATWALGYQFSGPIWVTPMLTGNGFATYASRRDIVMAQILAPTTIAGVRLLPTYSQFANQFNTDLIHPLGGTFRYYAELVDLYMRSVLTPPRIVSKAVSGSTVVVGFDQAIKYGSVPDLTTPGNSKDGFSVIDNTGAEVAVSATAITGPKQVTLTVSTTANLSGSWFVHNGLQQAGTIGALADPTTVMPRTRIVGTSDVGTAQDGTVLQNSSLPQEF